MKVALAILVAAACSPAPVQRLPGGSLTPKSQTRMTASACGYDVSFGGATPDIRYRYALDAFGRVAHITGTYPTGPDESIDYSYDHLDHMTHMLDTRTLGNLHAELTERYDTLGDLLEYATVDAVDGSRSYVYSAFSDTGQPTREVIWAGRESLGYQLTYDAADRITLVTADDGTLTTYTYDDDGRTMTIDTGGGAFRGVVIYDDRDHELSESWDGTDPAAIASENLYAWDGDRLLAVTYRSGSQDAPHQLVTLQVDTLRYDCATR